MLQQNPSSRDSLTTSRELSAYNIRGLSIVAFDDNDEVVLKDNSFDRFGEYHNAHVDTAQISEFTMIDVPC